MVEKLNGKAYGTVMILAISGNDEHIGNCLPTVLSSGSTIHTTALGSSAVKNLEELLHTASKQISKNVYFRAFALNLNIQSITMKPWLCQEITWLNGNRKCFHKEKNKNHC